jgi:hypothetical protein
MAVYCEAISVLIRRHIADEKVNGGCIFLAETFPGGSMWGDESLLRFGFMAPSDAGTWTNYLGSLGLTFTVEEEGSLKFLDFAVVDQKIGLTTGCNWLETEIIEGHRWAWTGNRNDQTFLLPAVVADHQMNFISRSKVEGLPFSTSENLDITIDPTSGKPHFVGRVFDNQQFFDQLVRKMQIEYGLGNLISALQIQRQIDYLRSTSNHVYIAPELPIQAARLLTDLSLSVDPDFALEALQRWVEVTESDIGRYRSECWLHRGILEKRLNLRRDASRSLRQSNQLRTNGS